MKEFQGRVAVITGAASGIGRGIADRCAQEGMKVVLSGINQSNLDPVEVAFKEQGTEVISVQADVSKREDIQRLADTALDAFGAVHLLVNNAGVGAGTTVWESTWNDWEWVINVNLWGVIHGMKIFTPIMLAQKTEGHIVNVSSIAGLLPRHLSAPYMVTKHAVVALSEQQYYNLAERGTKLGISVLCPGWVKTRIMESERNRPPEFRNERSGAPMSGEEEAAFQHMLSAVDIGIPPEEVADQVFVAIKQKQFYILTHSEYNPIIKAICQCRLSGSNPPIG